MIVKGASCINSQFLLSIWFYAFYNFLYDVRPIDLYLRIPNNFYKLKVYCGLQLFYAVF